MRMLAAPAIRLSVSTGCLDNQVHDIKPLPKPREPFGAVNTSTVFSDPLLEPRAKTASAEVRRVKYQRGSLIAASSVHWPRGHAASGGENSSTMLRAPCSFHPPATRIFPRKCVAASPRRAVLMRATDCQKSVLLAIAAFSRQSARNWQHTTESSQREPLQPPKTKTRLSPGREAAAGPPLLSGRSGSLYHLLGQEMRGSGQYEEK
uniref:Uncharacterized protein n=1 Tax=Schistocephalus solidus TaxID=70667 RepID=A0A0X3NMN7_SCHSO